MISIIPKDQTIVIDGFAVSDENKRVSPLFASDIHAVQFDQNQNIGEIEFVKPTFKGESPVRLNQRITEEDIQVDAIKEIHATLVLEMQAEMDSFGEGNEN